MTEAVASANRSRKRKRTMASESDVAVRRPNCVVIDTNIWRSELLLKTPSGMSLVYTLGRQHEFLGLPEIIERELKRHVLQGGLEAVEQANKYSRIISTLTGSPPFPFSTSPSALEKIVAGRLAELAPILKRIPFTSAHAIDALDMVDAKLPPNAKTQQFKDSATWQAILDLSQDYAVHFITNDREFLLDRGEPSKGLAANLVADYRRRNGSVAVYCDLDSCLEGMTNDEPPLDRSRLIPMIEAIITPRVLDVTTTQVRIAGFELKEFLSAEITAFWGTDPNRVPLDYTIILRFEVSPASRNDQEGERRAVTHGSCYYDRTSDSLVDGFIQEMRFLSKTSSYARSFPDGDSSIPFPRPLPWR